MARYINRLINTILLFLTANYLTVIEVFSVHPVNSIFFLPAFLLICFIIMNIFPSFSTRKLGSARLRVCANGCELLIIFSATTIFTIIYTISGFLGLLPIDGIIKNPWQWILHTIFAIIVLAIVFWNGITRVYTTSVQLGVRWRVLGIILGFIPIANIIMLGFIIDTVLEEVKVENEKILTNNSRHLQKLCETKYPILLVHGVFFRDSNYLNYWGRIPKELTENGATIFYGNHQSAASVEDSAKELTERIKKILDETGCEKLNIIAHSKGGLDCRYAISMLGADKYVASLTTINTPHRGCEFADYLLSKIPTGKQQAIAKAYNTALQKLGDENPDFLAAVCDLTASSCNARNDYVLDKPEVYYQSIGSKLNAANGGRFPLNFTYHLVNHFDGFNDGLVGELSFPWGNNYTMLTVNGKRGISHGDVIDMNRENFRDFDVREFYVELVNSLKKKGL